MNHNPQKGVFIMRRKEPVTLTDVAAAASVSQSTVSRVLSRHPRVNGNTRKRVLDTIAKLGYDTSAIQRKQAARNSKATLNIEFLLCPRAEQKDMLSLSYFSTVFDSARNYFGRTDNVNLNLCTWDKTRAERPWARLAAADGALVIGTPDRDLLRNLADHHIRCVLIACGSEEFPLDVVGTDNISAGAAAARYLLDNGFTRIGFVDFPDSEEWRLRKLGALAETAERCGAEHFQCRVSASTAPAPLAATFREWMAEGTFPEALILPYSKAMLSLELVLHENGLSCPADVSVISFDDGVNDSFHTEPARFELFPDRIGAKAAQRLLQLIHGSDETPHRIDVPFDFIPGKSVRTRK